MLLLCPFSCFQPNKELKQDFFLNVGFISQKQLSSLKLKKNITLPLLVSDQQNGLLSATEFEVQPTGKCLPCRKMLGAQIPTDPIYFGVTKTQKVLLHSSSRACGYVALHTVIPQVLRQKPN